MIANPYTEWANRTLNSDAVILDTETTGLSGMDEVIQMAAIDMRGNQVFYSLFKPACSIHPSAAAVHQMTEQHLVDAPAINDMEPQLREVLDGRMVIAYNADFDRRLLNQTFAAHRLSLAWLSKLSWQCAMKAWTGYMGLKKAPKLENSDHTAMGDCLATLDLLRQMAGNVKLELGQQRATLTPAQRAYKTIKQTLLDEQAWRKRVFNGAERNKKVSEIDDALKALDVMAEEMRRRQTESTPIQPVLLGGEQRAEIGQ